MVSSCDHISKSLSWFTTRSLRCEIIQQACQNISLLLLWGHYALKPKVQPFYTEALIYFLPVQVLLHLFWYAVKSGHWHLSPAGSRHCHVCVNTVGGAQGLWARTDCQVLQHNIYLVLKFSVQKFQIFQRPPWVMKTASQRSRHQPPLHHELLWDSETNPNVLLVAAERKRRLGLTWKHWCCFHCRNNCIKR